MKPSSPRFLVAALALVMAQAPFSSALAKKRAVKEKPAATATAKDSQKQDTAQTKKADDRKGPAKFSRQGAAFDPEKAKIADKKRDDAIDWGLSGPTIRGSGVN